MFRREKSKQTILSGQNQAILPEIHPLNGSILNDACAAESAEFNQSENRHLLEKCFFTESNDCKFCVLSVLSVSAAKFMNKAGFVWCARIAQFRQAFDIYVAA